MYKKEGENRCPQGGSTCLLRLYQMPVWLLAVFIHAEYPLPSHFALSTTFGLYTLEFPGPSHSCSSPSKVLGYEACVGSEETKLRKWPAALTTSCVSKPSGFSGQLRTNMWVQTPPYPRGQVRNNESHKWRAWSGVCIAVLRGSKSVHT